MGNYKYKLGSSTCKVCAQRNISPSGAILPIQCSIQLEQPLCCYCPLAQNYYMRSFGKTVKGRSWPRNTVNNIYCRCFYCTDWKYVKLLYLRGWLTTFVVWLKYKSHRLSFPMNVKLSVFVTSAKCTAQ